MSKLIKAAKKEIVSTEKSQILEEKIKKQAPNNLSLQFFSENSEKPKRTNSLFQHKKYLYCLLPVFFLFLFFVTAEHPHQGIIKTRAFTYYGTILKDEPDGKGKITFSNGDSYNGNFKQGKFDGQGVYSSKTGKWNYTGKFIKGLAEGKGLMKTSDGKSHAVIYRNGALVQ